MNQSQGFLILMLHVKGFLLKPGRPIYAIISYVIGGASLPKYKNVHVGINGLIKYCKSESITGFFNFNFTAY